MAFTEFYADPTHASASNLNAGSTTGAPSVTITNGDWGFTDLNAFNSTGAFAGVSVGEWASVYLDGATTAVYIARITSVDPDYVFLSTTAKMGTAPSTGATGRSIRIGGVWAGPSGASGFPFNLIESAAQDASSNPPRCNLRNSATYSISSAITHSTTGVTFQGYTSSAGDLGRATFDKSTNTIVLLTVSGARNNLVDLIFTGSDASGTSAGVSITNDTLILRCKSSGHRGAGFSQGGGLGIYLECEVSGCNTANTSAIGGFLLTGNASGIYRRCYSHDNTGGNASGWVSSTSADQFVYLFHCVADSNGLYGAHLRGNSGHMEVHNNDFYSNGGDGLRLEASTSGCIAFVTNNNFVLNGGYGIRRQDTIGTSNYFLFNNGYGAGTKANTSGTTNGNVQESGAVTYTSDVNPWNDPANGDFTITLAGAKGAGRGAFPPGMTGTGYPDIGAVQHQDAGSGGGLMTHPGMQGGCRG